MEAYWLWSPSPLENAINKWQRRIEEHGQWKQCKEQARRILNIAAMKKELMHKLIAADIDIISFVTLRSAFYFLTLCYMIAVVGFLIELLVCKKSPIKERKYLKIKNMIKIIKRYKIIATQLRKYSFKSK